MWHCFTRLVQTGMNSILDLAGLFLTTGSQTPRYEPIRFFGGSGTQDAESRMFVEPETAENSSVVAGYTKYTGASEEI